MSDLTTYNIILINLIALIGIIRHKDNIKRLIAGNENKIGGRKWILHYVVVEAGVLPLLGFYQIKDIR